MTLISGCSMRLIFASQKAITSINQQVMPHRPDSCCLAYKLNY